MFKRLLPDIEAEGNLIRAAWDKLHRLPGGSTIFHKLLGQMVPYTGAMGARVLTLREGFACVELVERHAIRNHLRSIHAIALANLIELTGNLAVAYGLPDDQRFIVRGIRVTYHKKSRGRVLATAAPTLASGGGEQAIEVHVEVRDAAGDLCCEGWLDTLVGPKKKR